MKGKEVPEREGGDTRKGGGGGSEEVAEGEGGEGAGAEGRQEVEQYGESKVRAPAA